MSLTFATEDGWIVSHLNYMNNIYKNIADGSALCSLEFNSEFFDINTKYLRQNQIRNVDSCSSSSSSSSSSSFSFTRNIENNGKTSNKKDSKIRKRKLDLTKELSHADSEQMKYIQRSLAKLLSTAKERGHFTDDARADNNKAARLVSQRFYTESFRQQVENLYGCNKSERAVISATRNERYVFPERCSFYCYDVRQIANKMEMANQFDFILLDPPWWNKSIRRKKNKCAGASYTMMYNEELAKIPIAKLLSSNGIVAVWCTNAPSHLRSISDEMFPAWGVSYRAKWYWVKVTSSGETVCDFNPPPGKQPYELLLLGSVSSNTSIDIPNGKLLVSVPSAVHSHKPPLTEVIKSYLPRDPNCLEIFARYLLPGWTSWGLEVLKFQHLSLYSIVHETTSEVETNSNT
ncbi:N(6)-adenine-specific methyltransferase METTL4 isoform X1 [Neodiprion pinetum]|uniref:N(6)-adenine-specific methyltransferase METTL4 isoform X1 n=1 Tax=Neodiprion pinetum TaxID=441929 RepID=UPI001EE137D6|nr:N(6)-adenine-specific methyltransferase METTL4 [Neodiprion pinetum]